jgi:hypothetical protein
MHKKSVMSSKYRKRQQYNMLKNDLSGYSIQRECSLTAAILFLTLFSLLRKSFTDGGSLDRC